MDYELGLERLEQLVQNDANLYDDFLIYEQQLRENLEEEKFGTNEQIRSGRARITAQLNRLARQVGTRSFNDLCRRENISNFLAPRKTTTSTVVSAPLLPLSIKPNPQRTRVYISFSEQDKSYRDELHAALNQFKSQGLEYWDHLLMMGGANRENTITAALNSTRVAITLVSADFLGAGSTDFINTLELPALLAAAKKEEIALLNVIVRPCSIDYSALQAFQPANPRPLSSMSRDGRDEFWNQFARQVLSLLH